MKKNAVVLLSGGLDSTTVLAIAKADGYIIHALSFRYGQRHTVELDRAQAIAQNANVKEHKIASVDLALFGGSALTDASIAVPKGRDEKTMAEEIPVTYVPARNTIFLSYALGYAEVVGAQDIFIGVNAVDYSGYPDCRPEYIACFTELANLATAAGVTGKRFTIHTPLISLTKGEIIKRGLALGVDYAQTLSCYDPSLEGVPCGLCDACQLRQKGFAENGMHDPALP